MQRQSSSTLGRAFGRVLGVVVLGAAAWQLHCDCGGTSADGCTTTAECGPGRICVEHVCVTLDATGEEGVDVPVDQPDILPGDDGAGEDGPRCPSGIFCGTPPECCTAGDECIEGACVPPCPSGVRCGAGGDVCCDAGQVCIGDACEVPGDECIDSFECPEDFFCEPTLGRCLPQLDPVVCEVRHTPEPFEVREEWAWTGSTVLPEYTQPIAAPLVVDLDGDRVPEVVVSMAMVGEWQDAVLRALSGDSGTDVWTVTDTAYRLNGRASIAAGDIDGDTHPELLGTGRLSPSPIFAFEHDGTFKWASADAAGTPTTYTGVSKGIAVADLEGDGSPEIIAGGIVLNANGRERWSQGGMEGDNSYGGGQPTVADLDMDTEPEVVTGRRTWHADGTMMWEAALPDGYPAVADFAGLGLPQVALVASGTVRIIDGLTGALYWGPVTIPGGGRGGPPTVADFDGDGRPEIGRSEEHTSELQSPYHT
jgi:hypothetical protein